MANHKSTSHKTYVVEHLDPELGPWSTLEYLAIAQESKDAGATFYLSSVPHNLKLPEELRKADGLVIENRSVEEIYANGGGHVCLLDPAATIDLSPEDGVRFDVFLFGGILDRTSELRKKGFTGRRLGSVQMTTDTAVRVVRTVVQQNVNLDAITYVDNPELRVDEHESTEMPFRYVSDVSGQPIMPKGMMELIKKDSEKGFEDLL